MFEGKDVIAKKGAVLVLLAALSGPGALLGCGGDGGGGGGQNNTDAGSSSSDTGSSQSGGESPSYDDLSYDLDPSSLAAGKANYKISGAMQEDITCDAIFKPMSTNANIDNGTYYKTISEINCVFEFNGDSAHINIDISMLDEQEADKTPVEPGTYVAFEENAQGQEVKDKDTGGISVHLNTDEDFYGQQAEIVITEVDDTHIVGKVKGLFEQSFADVEPEPVIGVVGAFHATAE